MSRLYLVPVGEMRRFRRTVAEPVDLTDAPIRALRDVDEARVWATTTGERKRTFFDQMAADDPVLFYRDGEFFATGRAGRVFVDPEAGKWLWNDVDSRFVYTVTDYRPAAVPVERVNDLLGYRRGNVPNGFMKVSESATEHLLASYDSVDEAFEHLRG